MKKTSQSRVLAGVFALATLARDWIGLRLWG
jgi:hypothetical protein